LHQPIMFQQTCHGRLVKESRRRYHESKNSFQRKDLTNTLERRIFFLK
jgi:hypothetical protein